MPLLVFSACGDDVEEVLPSYITDFVVAETDADGVVSAVKFDDGTNYKMTNQRVQAQAADSAYRCIATYEKCEDDYLFYNLSPVLSPIPVCADSIHIKNDKNELPHDPVKVTSVWKGRDYVNMQLGVLTTGNGKHKYAFCIDSISNGTEYVSLVHLRAKEDAESYTSKLYASMPMVKASEDVNAFVLRINTYEGWKQYVFE